jgi:hypothetical protein
MCVEYALQSREGIRFGGRFVRTPAHDAREAQCNP